MIARPPQLACPSCPAGPGQWCHDEEHRVCAQRQIRAVAAARGRDAIAEAARLRDEERQRRLAAIRSAARRVEP